MNQFFTRLLNLSFGQFILMGSSVLVAFFLTAVLWQIFRAPRSSKNQALEPEKEFVRKDPILSQALNKADKLEDLLNKDLQNLKQNLYDERENITLAVQALKNIALEKKLPQTLFQIYSETKSFPKKSMEAQEVDMEWHRKVGISDLNVVPIIGEDGITITFVLLRHVYHLDAILHNYARIKFVELILMASDHKKLMVARVKPDGEMGRFAEENAVMEMNNGEWVDDLIACRLLMDKRQSELDLLANHQEVEQLKKKFRFNFSSKKQLK
jgi:hypothetical protein